MISKLLFFWKHLDHNSKKNFFVILFITLLGGFLEMIGIGLIIPLLTSIVNNESHPIVGFFLNFTNFNDNSYISIIFIFVSFFILKNIVLSFVTFFQYKMLSQIRHIVSCKLFNNYINLNYSFFIKHNSSEITRNLTTAITQFNSYVLVPLSVFLTEFFVIIFLIFFAIAVNPIGSLILFFSLLIPVLIFFNYTKFRVKHEGINYSDNEALRIKYINEMMGSIRDIKLHNKENFFNSNYIKSDFLCTNAQFKLTFFSQIVKYLLEISLIIAIFIFIFIASIDGYSFNNIIPMLGFYALVGFKVTPSLNRMINTSQALKYGETIIDILNKEFSRNLPKKNEPTVQKESIEKGIFIRDLSFSYDRNNHILEKINLAIKKGDVIGITGETGSGKSTLLNLLLGFLEPSKGTIYIDNHDIRDPNISFKNLIGYVPQEIFLIDDTILNNIAFCYGHENIDLIKVNWAIKEAGLEKFIKGLKSGIKTKIGERGIKLSGGQRQRIGIARALFFGAKVLIFDEATSALDNKTEKLVMTNISRLKDKFTIILVAHRISTLQSCNKVYNLADKKLKIRKL